MPGNPDDRRRVQLQRAMWPLLLVVCAAAAASGQIPGAALSPRRTRRRHGIELADVLRQHLRKDKIVLVGHSWGSILGGHMAKARPELFYTFVATGQVGDPATSYPVAHRELLAKLSPSS